ncbi:M20/M25/M40 family metallo-hydrolase [Fontivita pretiosa]|uniref:M20/M25/M40 family metallo-hydrolase n=1 Tax=Fontivita pretiosa TaxID=2989684 RepID=UPI003D1770D5
MHKPRLPLAALTSLLFVPIATSLLAAPFGCNSQRTEVRATTTPAPAADAAAPGLRPTTALADEHAVDSIRQHLQYLASDELEGRGVGTRGLDLAADYIAARLREIGLKPLPGQDGYFQRFEMSGAASVDPANTSLAAGDTIFELSRQYTPTGFSADGSFSAPVVFAGYGISNPDRGYDDYAGIDVKGKVVLVLRYEPHNEQGKSRFDEHDWSPDASLNSKARTAAEHGAAAILLVNPPKYHGEQDELMTPDRGGARSRIPFIHIARELANELLKRGGSSRDLAALQSQIDAEVKPQSFELKDLILTGQVKLRRDKVPVRNVLAYLPGSVRPDEYVVVGAHYDHLGWGHSGSLAQGIRAVHNGADDNASGTSAVLELARQLSAAGPLDRSVIFAFFTGEEWGLIGSEHFADHPPVPLEKIVAMVNLDMVGRVRNDTLYVGGRESAAAFDAILNRADEASVLQLKTFGLRGMQSSDHYTFAQRRIPHLFFFSGLHADYHRPSDDPDKINYRGIAEVVDLAEKVVTELAGMPRQQYVAATLPADHNGGGTTRRFRVSLGVMPDYGSDESTVGVRITGTTPGSPAEKAGLRDGDIIVQLGEKKIENLYDLMDFLGRASPGEEVKIVIRRNGEYVQSRAVLAPGRRG